MLKPGMNKPYNKKTKSIINNQNTNNNFNRMSKAED